MSNSSATALLSWNQIFGSTWAAIQQAECAAYTARQQYLANLPIPPRQELQDIYGPLDDAGAPAYTVNQIQMRRKVEVLKHPANSARISKSASRLASSNSRVFALHTLCAQNPTAGGTPAFSSWSYQCGVPGAPVLLTFDPAVPFCK